MGKYEGMKVGRLKTLNIEPSTNNNQPHSAAGLFITEAYGIEVYWLESPRRASRSVLFGKFGRLISGRRGALGAGTCKG